LRRSGGQRAVPARVPARFTDAGGDVRAAPGRIALMTTEHDEVEVLAPGQAPGGSSDGAAVTETVSEPAKVMRVGSMVKQLLDEVKSARLDDRSRERLAVIYPR